MVDGGLGAERGNVMFIVGNMERFCFPGRFDIFSLPASFLTGVPNRPTCMHGHWDRVSQPQLGTPALYLLLTNESRQQADEHKKETEQLRVRDGRYLACKTQPLASKNRRGDTDQVQFTSVHPHPSSPGDPSFHGGELDLPRFPPPPPLHTYAASGQKLEFVERGCVRVLEITHMHMQKMSMTLPPRIYHTLNCKLIGREEALGPNQQATISIW